MVTHYFDKFVKSSHYTVMLLENIRVLTLLYKMSAEVHTKCI